MRKQSTRRRPAILTPIARHDLKPMLRGSGAAAATLAAFVLVILSVAG